MPIGAVSVTTPQDVMAELDAQIRDDAAALCAQALSAGWRADELPTILRPWLEQVVLVRAKALARLERINRADWRVASVH